MGDFSASESASYGRGNAPTEFLIRVFEVIQTVPAKSRK
jgi:hypothetical protein